MEGDTTPAIRPFVSVVDRCRSVAARLDTTFLKRVGVVTYFGVYAAIALGGRAVLNAATGTLPPFVRPPALAPLHVTLGLPRSFAWGLVSFTTTLLVLGVLVAVSLYRDDHGTDARPARLGGTSLTETLAPATRARAVGRRVRSVGSRIRGSVPESPSSIDGDRLSPSTDGGATVDPDASGAAGSTGDDGDGSSGGGRAREEPTVDPLNPFGGEVPVDPVDAFDDAEVLVDDEHADDGEVVDEERDGEVAHRSEADDEPVGDTGGGPVAEGEPATGAGVDHAGSSDAPDESAPWPDEAADAGDADGEETGATGDEEEPSADAEWPDDWIPGDEL